MDSLIFAFRYFTNLPLPADLKWNEKTAAAALAWLPFTGLSIGLCLSALALFMQNTGFPQSPLLKSMLVMALELWLGGSLFISGFSRACDGLFSGLGPGRSLEIMEDSHIGVKGALSLALSLLAKAALLSELSLYGDFLFILLFYPCLARWAASFTACHYPVAKEEGMAFFFKIEQKPVYILLGSVFLLLTLIVMPRYFYLAVLLSFLLLLFCCSLVQSRIGGQTDDSYGLASVVAELSFLLFCAVCGV
ncbi:MAG: adenosylcobinamide-GDP ribazoletransferase, partial [Clostridiales bacterium]|nr:adenosylcobinamide-GDP ribazoletransferase [Clostridiales bacterium]